MDLSVKLLLIFLISVSCIGAVYAAPPAGVEAGTINRDIEEKKFYKDPIQEKRSQQTEKKITPLKMNVEEYEKLPAQVKKTGFVLKEIIYDGNTVYTDEELDGINTDYFDSFVTLDRLKLLMNRITNHYTSEGYIATFAYLPAQKIKDGRLKISIMEGKISKIDIKGNKWAKKSFLRNNMLKSNGVKQGKVLNINDLKKSLGKINQADYMKGKAVLNKGEDLKSSEVLLEVEDRFPLELRAGWNNQGREYIGKQRAVLTLGNENVTGYGDRAYASTIFARDTFGVSTDYYIPLGPYKTELRIGYGYTDLEIGKAYKAQGFNGKSHRFHASLLQPIYEGQTTKLTSDLTFDTLGAKTYINNSTLYEKYNLRALRIGLNGIKDDSSGRWVSRIEASTGIPLLGATTTQIRSGGSSRFFRINPGVIRIQKLPYQVTGLFKLSGQYAPSRLLAVEQLQLGGLNTVRGYQEGTLFAHTGYFMSLELRKPIIRDWVELAVFYDQGLGKIRGQSIKSENLLHSVGVGFRIRLWEYLNANLDFGFPIGGSVTPSEKDFFRFHFGITSDII